LFPLSLIASTACAEAKNADPSSFEGTEEALRTRPGEGAVFSMSNDAMGNAVLAFHRDADGSLKAAESYPTGGLGTGASLGSQGSVTLSEDGRFLLVVNAGSNDISSFAVRGSQLNLMDLVSSGGTLPTSVAVRDDLVYVLNAGQNSVITGFLLDNRGKLNEIPKSARALSTAMPSAAEVAIAPSGREVIVTEKGTNVIDSFEVERDGTLGMAEVHASSGAVPYGFDFSPLGTIVVSEAAPGAVSSYSFDRHDNVMTISPSVADNQQAPCWLVVTKDGRFAYTANAGSSSISGYSLARDGSLQLLDPNGVTALLGQNGKPLDLALDHSHHLYVVDAANHGILGFAVGSAGNLSPVANTLDMRATSVGIAAL